MKDQILSIVAEFDTPCYVYDQALIERNVERFRSVAYPDKAIHFASMANNNPMLMAMLKEAGFGIFVNSVKHLQIALESGFAPRDIIYTSTGVRRQDMEHIVERGIAINLDSVSQLDLYGSLDPGGSVGVRLNIEEHSLGNVFVGTQSRIGVLETEFPAVHDTAARHGLRVAGTHVYLGTNIVSLDTMLAGVERTLELSERFPELRSVDLGGGFPVAGADGLTFDYASYDRRITEVFERFSQRLGRRIQLVLEPGRALFGDTAVFCTRVLDVKERPDRFLVCCDASVSLFPRPMFYDEYHDVVVHGREHEPPAPKPVDVVGATTYSRDFLGRKLRLPPVEIGDVLVFQNAGSYCYSMITQFLGQAAPSEVLVTRSGEPRLIRDREAVLV